MNDPFLGMIALFGFNYAPRGWAICDGSLLPIAQNTALYSLLGTTYGGNGATTFALPDLRGRVPLGMGQGPGLSYYNIGQQNGSENVTINTNQLPAHTHSLMGTGNTASSNSLNGNVLASSNGSLEDGTPITVNAYGPAANMVTASPAAIGVAGGSQPVPVVQPILAMNYCIALVGIYPPRD